MRQGWLVADVATLITAWGAVPFGSASWRTERAGEVAMSTTSVFILSADASFRSSLCEALIHLDGIEITGSIADAKTLARVVAASQPDIVLADLPPIAVRKFIADMRAASERSKILLFVESLEDAGLIHAVHQGVEGYLLRDASPSEWLHAMRVVLSGDVWIKRRILFDALRRNDDVLITNPLALKIAGLTERERQIVADIRCGLSNKEIARQLDISPTTVKTHIQHIFSKLGIHGRMRLVARSAAASR
ncbi:MAG: response regulator transcription factor [Gammaproteobacteria bacterium]|nr:MAG: response regulator transcription factor [Gammaproteobacteria bacterium]